VEAARIVLSGRVAATLLGEGVDEHGPGQADGLAEHLHELLDIMAVDGAEVGEAEGLEEHSRDHHALDAVAEAVHGEDHRLAHREALEHAGEVLAGAADGGRDIGAEHREMR
jgi:hypothetical protein